MDFFSVRDNEGARIITQSGRTSPKVLCCQVPFILQKETSMQSLTTLRICKFHHLGLISQHTECGNNIQKLLASIPLYSQFLQ